MTLSTPYNHGKTALFEVTILDFVPAIGTLEIVTLWLGRTGLC